jgi:hypothetical protein
LKNKKVWNWGDPSIKFQDPFQDWDLLHLPQLFYFTPITSADYQSWREHAFSRAKSQPQFRRPWDHFPYSWASLKDWLARCESWRIYSISWARFKDWLADSVPSVFVSSVVHSVVIPVVGASGVVAHSR